MAPGEVCAASILSAAGCARGTDLRVVAARLGVPVWLVSGLPTAACTPIGICRPGRRSYDDDQLELARALGTWAAARAGIYADDVWIDAFAAAITSRRAPSGERAAVSTAALKSG